MVFEVLLLIGFFGFVAMASMGLFHGGGHHTHGGDGHHGPIGDVHGPSHAIDGHAAVGAHVHSSHVAHVPHHSHAVDGTQHSTSVVHWGMAKLLPFLSPLNIFSMCLGAGATGLLLKGVLAGPFLVLAAIAGALVMDLLVMRPLMNVIIRFGSKPSEGLEGKVASIAEAVSAFDAQGRGLVKLTLDGEIVQLLGMLDPHEKAVVKKGDRVLVTEVDSTKGICKVSRETTED